MGVSEGQIGENCEMHPVVSDTHTPDQMAGGAKLKEKQKNEAAGHKQHQVYTTTRGQREDPGVVRELHGKGDDREPLC